MTLIEIQEQARKVLAAEAAETAAINKMHEAKDKLAARRKKVQHLETHTAELISLQRQFGEAEVAMHEASDRHNMLRSRFQCSIDAEDILAITTHQDQVREFMELVGQNIPPHPIDVSKEVHTLRIGMIEEETEELWAAIAKKDLVEMADALADILYVTYGYALTLGIDINEVFAEVQRTNMAKAPNGVITRREDGKILKPEGWKPSDIAAIIEKQLKEGTHG